MSDTRARINLALSILNNAGETGLSRAVTEARMALEGVTLAELVDFRCHGYLRPGVYCTTCGAYRPDGAGA